MSLDLHSPLSVCAWIAVAALVAYVGVAIRMRGPEDPLLAQVLRPICTLYAKLFHRLRFVAPAGNLVPAQGPAIVVANHRSGVDPLLIGLVTRRRIRFLMAREYYATPGLQWGFRALGCIPVNRDGNDLGATKAALKALRDGEVIGIFPQGGIREAGGSMEGKAGVALLALRTGAPVVPFHIDGSPNLDSVFLSLFTPSRTTVTCGLPLKVGDAVDRKPARGELEKVTMSILDAVAKLAPPPSGDARASPPATKAL
jgi:1-acyl-sn-glycerol-3-phosphate acyltransferase